MCETSPDDLHKIINRGLPRQTQLRSLTPSQEDWAMALTIQKNEGYFRNKPFTAKSYVDFRNQNNVDDAYLNFSKTDTKDAFGASFTEIQDWQKNTGGCAFHTVQKTDKK